MFSLRGPDNRIKWRLQRINLCLILCVALTLGLVLVRTTQEFIRWWRAEGLVLAPDRVPSQWQATDLMAAACSPDNAPPSDIKVLAWAITENERMYMENCIVWLHWDSPRETKWALAELIRFPREGRKVQKWQLCIYDHLPIRTYIDYYSLPRSEDICQFMDGCRWPGSVDAGFSVVDAEICKTTWGRVARGRPENWPKTYPTRKGW